MMKRKAVWDRRDTGEGQRKKEPLGISQHVFHRGDEHCIGEFGAGAGEQSRLSGPTKSIEQRAWGTLQGW